MVRSASAATYKCSPPSWFCHKLVLSAAPPPLTPQCLSARPLGTASRQPPNRTCMPLESDILARAIYGICGSCWSRHSLSEVVLLYLFCRWVLVDPTGRRGTRERAWDREYARGPRERAPGPRVRAGVRFRTPESRDRTPARSRGTARGSAHGAPIRAPGVWIRARVRIRALALR